MQIEAIRLEVNEEDDAHFVPGINNGLFENRDADRILERLKTHRMRRSDAVVEDGGIE